MAIPPPQVCMECGESIGRKWRPGVCTNCKKEAEDIRKETGGFRQHRKTHRQGATIPDDINYPDDSSIDDLRDWIEKGPDEVDKIWGHIGSRDSEGEWDRFDFEILDATGDLHTVSITPDDLGDDLDWEDFFDWLEDYADEYDIDYDNPYGEK